VSNEQYTTNRPESGSATTRPHHRLHELEMRIAAERAAHEFGVPVELLNGATSPEEIQRITSEALLWRAETAPPPPPPQTGAVSVDFANGVGALGPVDRLNLRFQGVQTRDSQSRMSPAEVLAAWRSGHLSQIGVGAPQANGATPLTRRR
jgi:hypothetical protein